MIALFNQRHHGPIGIDLGSRAVKMVQFNAERTHVIEHARWDLPADATGVAGAASEQLAAAISQAREGRKFHGRDVVIALGSRELFVKNIRVAKVAGGDLGQVIREEAKDRMPFSADEAEIRFIEAADVRQGETLRREVIVMACHRPALEKLLQAVEDAGMNPVAVDVEPAALLRSYSRQFRRDEDQQQRAMFVHLGVHTTAVVIAEGNTTLFVKYIEIGGRHFDDAIAHNLRMSVHDASSLRRHNSDRRADQQDPEVTRGLAESIRPVVDRLANELSMCIRYHSVTFRGQPLARLVLGGGEANTALVETLASRLDLPCELGDPLRAYEHSPTTGRRSQWDIATGLALKEVH